MATIADMLTQALQHHQAGALPQAELLYRQILQADPANADALHLLGLLAYQTGRPEQALASLRQAVASQPGNAAVHSNLGVVFQALGRIEEAAGSLRQALVLRPDNHEARINLGAVLQQQGHLDEAIACYHAALRLQPNHPGAHSNLGNALKQQGRLDEAAASYRHALRLQPEAARAHYNLGVVLQEQGHLEEAVACYRQAIRLQPNYPAHLNLGNALKQQGRLDEALACYRQAVHYQPDNHEAFNNLGVMLQARGQRDEAIVCYRQALRLQPGNREILYNLGLAARDQKQLDDALAWYRQALALAPDFPEAHLELGNVLRDMGLLDDALAAYRRAVELRPEAALFHSNLVYALHFHPDYDAARLGAELRRWRERHADRVAPATPSHANDPDPERRLRIGYVSPNFGRHPVGFFLLPLLEAHDRAQVEVCCYAAVARPDDVTLRLRGHADRWRDVANMADAELADLIRQDRIDILVDLVAHMADSRLLVFARKPAPVQVSYLAYCSTTGLPAIDYRFTDPFLDPAGVPEAAYAEQSVWLPQTYWCYRPVSAMPPVGPLPARAAGHVTFGCLNNFCKVTPPTLEAWRSLLQSVPGSRLLLHAHPGAHRERVRGFFGAGGVAPERIEFVGFLPLADYLPLYHRIDIGLDPFPYAGGTTTCDSLWMGVPVVSLAGRTAVGRAGLSILSNVSLSDLVARTPAEYVRIAVDLAGDLCALAELRAGLRARLQQSPLTDAPRFARHVEEAYRAMWRRWCGAPA